MQRISNTDLPRAILDHLAAYRNHDAEAFMAALAPDALVNDIQREFLGHPAIRAWADKEIFGDNVTAEIDEAFRHGDNFITRCRIDGNFDKSKLPDPFILTFYFTLQGQHISQMTILHNKANAA